MKITNISKAEHLEELEEKDIKEIILEFESGVAKDLDNIRKMLEQLHIEIKSIERKLNYEINSKTETADITDNNQ